jgi:hypothetical protein
MEYLTDLFSFQTVFALMSFSFFFFWSTSSYYLDLNVTKKIPLMTLIQVLDLGLTVGHVIDRADTDLVPTVVHPTIVVQVLVHIGVVVILDQDPVMIPILEVGVARLVMRRQEVVHGHIHVIVLTAVKDHTLLCHIQVKIVRRS